MRAYLSSTFHTCHSRPLICRSPLSVDGNNSVSINLSASNFDFSSLLALQSTCPSVQSMLSSPSLSVVSVVFLWSSILCDVSSRSPRLLVPAVLHHPLFLSLHRISHPGVGLTEASVLHVCLAWACKRHGPLDKVMSPLPTEQDPDPCAFLGSWDSGSWEKVLSCSPRSVDLVSPLPFSQGFCYILTMIVRTSRLPKAVSLSSITAESCARAFISTWSPSSP